MRKILQRYHLFDYFTLFLAAAVVFGPILWLEISAPGQNDDYFAHIDWAQNIVRHPENLTPAILSHAAWQWLTAGARFFLRTSWDFAAFLVTFFSVFATAAILFNRLRKSLSGLLAGALALGLNLVGPILLIEPLKYLLFMSNGYISPTVYHNPTYLLLKPFAVLQFILALGMLETRRSGWKTILLAAVVSALAVFSKPNYALCLLPALGILTLIRLIKKQPVDWTGLLLGFALPSAAILGWQYAITFGSGGASTVEFAPLKLMSYYSNFLLLKLLLSILFPLLVTLLNFKKALGSRKMTLAWLAFVVSVLLVYLFAESGQQLYAANFLWSAEICLFILFAACVLFLAKEPSELQAPVKKWLILAAGFLQLACGVAYYFYIVVRFLLLQS